jgi:hypothetical protein
MNRKKSGLTADKLAAAIRFTQRADIVANAYKPGQELRKEKGVETAVKIIIDHMTTIT